MASRTYYPRAVVVLQALIEDYLTDAVDRRIYTYTVIPREVTVERNDHRTADTAHVEFDYKDAPFDPRTLRDLRVIVYLGNADDPRWATLPTDDRFLAFSGHADEPDASLDSSGEVVRFKCRDFTALFLDKKWVGPGALKIDRPLSEIVQDMITLTPGADGMIVSFDEGTDTLDLSTLKGRTKWAPQPGDDHWTILVELCGFAGLVPVMEPNGLRVINAGQLEVERQTAYFLYGDNVQKLQFSRKITDVRSKQIQVTCWDEQNRRTTVGTYPGAPIVKKQKITKKGKLSTDDEPILPFFISGTATAADCTEIAKRMYEEMSRSELEGTLETLDLTDRDGHDITQLKSGDALHVILGNTAAFALADGFGDKFTSESDMVAYLTARPRSWNPEAAAILAHAWWQAGDASTLFYVKKVTHKWSRESGYRFEANFINYVLQTG